MNKYRYPLLFIGLGAIFYIPLLGGVHLFDWDEINFAEISREMMANQDYLRITVNYEAFYQKPPFYFWLQVLAMKVFGINEFAARLPNAICGLITLPLLFFIGKRFYDETMGMIWAGVYFGTILPFLYFKSGIIDPWFNLFIFIGIYYFILFYWKKEGYQHIELPWNRWAYLTISGLAIGMGTLTKGQVAYLIPVLCFFIYWLYQRLRFYVNVPQFLYFTIITFFVMFAWYGLETVQYGTDFVVEFIKYQYRLFSTPDAGHKGFPGYHFAVLLVGCFPASIFLIRSFFKMPEEQYAYQANFRFWMKILFWVVLILFTIVRSKIVHYSSMCYFPLTFLAALVIYRILEGKVEYNRWMSIGLWSIGGLFIFATIALPIIAQNPGQLKPLFDDPFAQGNLDAQVNWTGWEVLPGIFLFLLLLFSIRWIRSGQKIRGFQALFGGTALFVMLTLIFFIKRIEGYSQRAAMDFFKSKQTEDCYIISHGYKTYGHLFYALKPPVDNPESYNKEWLLTGPIDKDVYVVTKVHKTKELEELPTLQEIDRKNGFVFYKRAK